MGGAVCTVCSVRAHVVKVGDRWVVKRYVPVLPDADAGQVDGGGRELHVVGFHVVRIQKVDASRRGCHLAEEAFFEVLAKSFSP